MIFSVHVTKGQKNAMYVILQSGIIQSFGIIFWVKFKSISRDPFKFHLSIGTTLNYSTTILIEEPNYKTKPEISNVYKIIIDKRTL